MIFIIPYNFSLLARQQFSAYEKENRTNLTYNAHLNLQFVRYLIFWGGETFISLQSRLPTERLQAIIAHI